MLEADQSRDGHDVFGAATIAREAAWAEAARRAHRESERLRFVTSSRGALAPLVVADMTGTLEMIGLRLHGGPMDFLCESDHPAALELCETVLSLNRPMLLGRLPARSPTIPALRAAARGRAVVVTRSSPPSLCVSLDASWSDPLAAIPSRKRNLMKRSWKKARSLGAVDVRFERPSAGTEVESLLSLFLEVEADGWKGRSGTAVALTDEVRFLREYAQLAAEEETLEVGLLTIGGQVAAMQIGVVLDQRFWWMKTGYRERFAEGSPGRLLLGESIGRAARAGLVAHELLGVPDPLKQAWANTSHPNVAVAVYPVRQWRSSVAVIRHGLEAAQRRLGPALRRWVGSSPLP